MDYDSRELESLVVGKELASGAENTSYYTHTQEADGGTEETEAETEGDREKERQKS